MQRLIQGGWSRRTVAADELHLLVGLYVDMPFPDRACIHQHDETPTAVLYLRDQSATLSVLKHEEVGGERGQWLCATRNLIADMEHRLYPANNF